MINACAVKAKPAKTRSQNVTERDIYTATVQQHAPLLPHTAHARLKKTRAQINLAVSYSSCFWTNHCLVSKI